MLRDMIASECIPTIRLREIFRQAEDLRCLLDFAIDLILRDFLESQRECHVLIDLKLGKLSHQDVGQMDSYIRMFDDLYKHPDDNPTLGLILCSDKNEAVVKYSVLSEHRQIFASKYLLELPTPEILQQEIIRERLQIDANIHSRSV